MAFTSGNRKIKMATIESTGRAVGTRAMRKFEKFVGGEFFYFLLTKEERKWSER